MGDPPDEPADQPDVPRIDRPILEDIRDRLRTAAPFETVVIESTGQTRLNAVVDPHLNPADLDDRFLDVRWYTNDDFRIHYQETWTDHTWQQRWDRHPNDHNTRDHLHPPPDAATPGEDRSWPHDYRDVMAHVLSVIADRNDELWRDR